MNEASQLAQLSLTQPGNGQQQSGRLAEDRLRDMYAVWKSIFDKAHSVALPHARPAGAEGGGSSTLAERASLQLVDSYERRQQAQEAAYGSAVADLAAESIAVAACGVASAPAVARANPSGIPPIVLTAAAQPTSAGVVRIDVTELAGDQRLQATQRPSLAFEAPPATMAAEMVHVFVSGTAVRVIVRDHRIAEDDALRAAFETASALVGQRAALKQLVLNGQILYRSAAPGQSGAATALMFV
jgi:hypothetical protein